MFNVRSLISRFSSCKKLVFALHVLLYYVLLMAIVIYCFTHDFSQVPEFIYSNF